MDAERPARPKRRRPAPRRGNPALLWGSVAAAVVVAAALVLVAVHFAKSRRGEPRLIGAWKSDADATIAALRKKRPVTDTQEQAMRKLFGKMTITYTATTFTYDLNGTVETLPYTVVSRNGDCIDCKTRGVIKKDEDEVVHICFVGADEYWVETSFSDVVECFRRIR
jgi:hypothetical protein